MQTKRTLVIMSISVRENPQQGKFFLHVRKGGAKNMKQE
ncbi:hypothetical protein ISE1_1664 [plant metagenome]|uniref:Uncharacterized protein n=1 Tax=plant metagenome TaxID=1297885 RepID=A0A484SM71_9ZZZZ